MEEKQEIKETPKPEVKEKPEKKKYIRDYCKRCHNAYLLIKKNPDKTNYYECEVCGWKTK